MARELTDEMIDAALARGAAERAKTPVASAARYDRDAKRIVVDFENGAALLVPAHALQGLEDASDDDIGEVELERGYALHWERLDVDFTIPGLLSGIFGTAKFMAAQGGRSRSDAKTAASRENGRKGGRPPKKLSPEALAVIGRMRKGRIIEAEMELPRDENGELILSKKEGVRIPRAVKERIRKMAREQAEAAAEEAARQKKAG